MKDNHVMYHSSIQEGIKGRMLLIVFCNMSYDGEARGNIHAPDFHKALTNRTLHSICILFNIILVWLWSVCIVVSSSIRKYLWDFSLMKLVQQRSSLGLGNKGGYLEVFSYPFECRLELKK
jgi:hypothetical protein